MDLINNKAGREIANKFPDKNIDELVQMIIDEINNGDDIVYFFDYYLGSNATNMINGQGPINPYGNQNSHPGMSHGTSLTPGQYGFTPDAHPGP